MLKANLIRFLRQSILIASFSHVGDIDIAYKVLGKGDPILLVSGGSSDMNSWDPSTLRSLSSNHTVIVFDSRGVGNTII